MRIMRAEDTDGATWNLRKYPEDVARLMRIALDNGAIVSPLDIVSAWESYSGIRMSAGWMDLNADDDRNWRDLSAYLVEEVWELLE